MPSDTLKIVHVSSPFSWRGGEQQLSYLHAGLLYQTGVETIVFCPTGSELSKRLNPHQVRMYSKKSGFDLGAARSLARICAHENISAVHAHDAHAHTTSVLAATVFGMKQPIVVSRRVDFPLKNKWFTRFKYNHKSVKHIICVSDCIANIVKPAIVKTHIQVSTVHSCADTSRFKNVEQIDFKAELGVPADSVLVANVAALADHKDQFTFLRTAQLLAQRDSRYQFVIVGNGELKKELKEYSVKLGLTNRVHFAGFRSDLPQIYHSFDCFLFTSNMEGLGTSILDAFANEIPVVATNAGGIPEMVINEETGMLCNVGDDNQLSAAVEHVVKDRTLREKLVRNASKKLNEFSPEYLVSATLDIYRNIV